MQHDKVARCKQSQRVSKIDYVPSLFTTDVAKPGQIFALAVLVFSLYLAGCISTPTIAAPRFLTISASDPRVVVAIPSHDLADAKAALGKDGSFRGIVVKIYQPYPPGGLTMLNFDIKYTTAAAAVVRPSAVGALPDMHSLIGKNVMVSGKWFVYRGNRIEMNVVSSSQIRVIQN
jgi:hypothetical protein